METYSTQITDYLLAQSWHIAILVAAVAAVSWLLKNKSAHVRYLLWLIVLAKCLVPPLVTIPLAVLPQEKPTLLLELQTASPMITEPVASAPARQVNPPVPVVVPPRTRVDMRQCLAVAWIAGVSVFVTVAVVKALQTISWLHRERKPLPAELHGTIEGLFREFGTLPNLWLIDGIGQPFVWGLLRGSIYLPADFIEVENGEHCRDVLGHELSHILRFDAAVNLLQVIAQAVFWFHPFVWWANKRIRAEREKCCDEMAIARLGAKVKDYTTAIVNILIAEHKSTRPVPSLAVAGPVKNIEERTKTMLRPGKKFYKRPSLVAAISVLLVAFLTVPTALVLTARAQTKLTAEPEEKPAKSLHEAALTGDIEQVKLLISKGADVNARDANRYTPLHHAIWCPSRAMAKLLVAKGADIDAKDDRGFTPLFWAIMDEDEELAELLVTEGADINSKDNTMYGYTILHMAMMMGQTKLTEQLLKRGADIHVRDNMGLTPLHHAAQCGIRDAVDHLLARGAGINALNNSAETPLDLAATGTSNDEVMRLLIAREAKANTIHFAARIGDLSKIKAFIEKDGDVNAKTSRACALLHAAGLGGHKEVVELLINKGANVSINSPYFGTPLHVAAGAGHKDVVELLMAKGVDVDAQHKSGRGALTPLHRAASGGHKDIVRLFISKGANVNENIGVSSTPLHEAARAGRREVVELLLAEGADANPKTKRGLTPLHMAALGGYKEVVEVLIAKGANINAMERNGCSILHIAVDGGHKDVVELLIAKGAEIDPKNKHGHTPLWIANDKGYTEIVELLRKHGAKE